MNAMPEDFQKLISEGLKIHWKNRKRDKLMAADCLGVSIMQNWIDGKMQLQNIACKTIDGIKRYTIIIEEKPE